MNTTSKITNDHFFSEPFDPVQESRTMTLEVISRLFIWMSEGQSLEERGVRATVAVYCIRPDLITQKTLEEIGQISGRSKQAVHKVAKDFCEVAGLV